MSYETDTYDLYRTRANGTTGYYCLEVRFHFDPPSGDGWNEPSYAASIDLEDILIGSRSVYDLLTPYELKDISDRVLEDYLYRNDLPRYAPSNRYRAR